MPIDRMTHFAQVKYVSDDAAKFTHHPQLVI